MIEQLDAKSIIIYIAIIAGLFIVAMAMKFKKSIAFKIVFRFIIGAVFIYAINAGAGFLGEKIKVDITIPLNPVTAAFVGYLQIPGLILVYLIKYIIYPVA